MHSRKKTHNTWKVRGNKNSQFLQFGSLGIKAITNGRLIEKKWEIIQKALHRKIKLVCGINRCKIWIPLELNNNLTKLNLESRMGKGKGSIYSKTKFIRKGEIIVEFSEILDHNQKYIILFLQNKLPFKIKLVKI